MTRFCKYNCGVELGAFDEENRKYLEAGTGGLHTKERCQEAKAKLEKKNDHGNESYSPTVSGQILEQGKETTELKSFVDHTLKGQSKVKIFSSIGPYNLSIDYNNFLLNNQGKIKTQGAQFQMSKDEDNSVIFAIALYYEETK